MSVRARLFPVLALLLAAATAIALTVALPGPGRGRGQRQPGLGERHLPGQRAGQRRRLPAAAPSTWAAQLHLGRRPAPQPPGRLQRRQRQPAPWNPNANNVVRALKVSPGGPGCTWAGTSSAVGGAARSRVASLSPTSGAAFGWSPYVNDQRQGDHHLQQRLHGVRGRRLRLGRRGRPGRHLAAFNATSGALTSLKPSISNGTGTSPPCWPWTSPPTATPSTSPATSPWSTAPRAATRPRCRAASAPCGPGARPRPPTSSPT